MNGSNLGKPDKGDKGEYSIHGVSTSQYSINTNPAAYGSNDFVCKSTTLAEDLWYL